MSETVEKNETAERPAGGAWEPKIVAFLCNWCSYAGADLAGVSRMQYGPNVRVIRVPCSGRINPLYIVKALQNGVDGVLVSGCHPGDCHYISGNLVARRRFALARSLLTYIGIEPERVQFSWVSASEGGRFAALMDKVIADVRRVGPAGRLVKDIAGEARRLERAAGAGEGARAPAGTEAAGDRDVDVSPKPGTAEATP
jgi:coenzyme F420-reducing hydrogenase delta subunit